jgi:hypothetical protein
VTDWRDDRRVSTARNNWLTLERQVTPGTATGASLLIDGRMIALKSKIPVLASRKLHAGSMPGREGQPHRGADVG